MALRWVDEIPRERLHDARLEDLVDEIVSKTMIRALSLRDELAEMDVEEVSPDLSRVRYTIPFEGDTALWAWADSTFGTLYRRGRIEGQRLVVTFEERKFGPEEVQSRLEDYVALLKRDLIVRQQVVDHFNRELRTMVSQSLSQRRREAG